MYDLPGADNGQEWIEITNNGDELVDLADWKFFEGGVNHKLTLLTGRSELAPGERAVIAEDAHAFLLALPDFSGTLFDSSFSLSNTGELLVIRDENLSDVNAVAYFSSWGGKGDGNSLQFFDTFWRAALPTPGLINVYIPPRVSQPEPVAEQTISLPEETIARTAPAALDEVGEKGDESEQEQSAAVGETILHEEGSDENTAEGLFVWLLALFGVLVLATGAVLVVWRRDSEITTADDIEILE